MKNFEVYNFILLEESMALIIMKTGSVINLWLRPHLKPATSALLIILCSSCSVTNTITTENYIMVHKAENIMIAETDITDQNCEVIVETRGPGTTSGNSAQTSNIQHQASNIQHPTSNIQDVPVRTSGNSADLQFYSRYSKRLGVCLDGTENKELIMAIDDWMGAPFKWGGCSKYGVDCSCFVKLVYEDVYGIVLNRTSRSIFYNDLVPVKKQALQEGDILSFKMKGDIISHIGIYLKDNKFVHVSRSKGVMISNINRRYYRTRFFSAGRVTEGLDILMASSSPRRIRLAKLVIIESAYKTRMLAKLADKNVDLSEM